MDTVATVRTRVLRLCEERKITINHLATVSALPLLTIKMICDGLGMTLGEFFSTPEFDALEQEIR